MESNDYKTSNDYNELLELLKKGKRVVCFAAGDIALAYRGTDFYGKITNDFYVTARGTMYVTAFGLDDLTPEEDFLKQCSETNLRFIPPTLTETEAD